MCSHTIFNIYTNNQPKTEKNCHILYTDDLVVMTQEISLKEIGQTITQVLKDIK